MKNSILIFFFTVINFMTFLPSFGSEGGGVLLTDEYRVIGSVSSVSDLPLRAGVGGTAVAERVDILRRNVATTARRQAVYDVYVTAPGELSQWLEAVLMQTDSVAVHGPVGAEDFRTLWHASFYGGLEVINLEDSSVEEGIIPQDAFVSDEQFTAQGFITTLLRRIILPEGVREIGDFAFSWCILLERINFPAGVRSLGMESFSVCQSLQCDIVFGEGLEHIGYACFSYCSRLRGSVEFPASLREIGAYAFFDSPVSSVSFAEGLERIGRKAFTQCCLEEVVLPQSCRRIGEKAFSFNRYLRRAVLPDRLEEIAEGLFYVDNSLEELTLPSSLKYVGPYALARCGLRELHFPEGFEILEYNALEGCEELEEVSFPSTLIYVGTQSCVWLSSLRRLYCAAPLPPFCEEVRGSAFTPFGLYDSDGGTSRHIPVYVPSGTSSAYRSSWGWNYFTDFIETTDFPGSRVGLESIGEDSEQDSVLYDLTGRRIGVPERGHIYVRQGQKILWCD